MNNYGKTALKAVGYCKKGYLPVEAWDKAAIEIFGNSTSAVKNCPKSAFLGLCEEGLVKNIPMGNYTLSEKNKDYALLAVAILKLNRNRRYTPIELWDKIRTKTIRHNSQMDVVLGLWENNLIID